MKVLQNLTFLLVIFALALPVANLANAADMQNCPHMMAGSGMSGDVPCHADGADNDMSGMNCSVDCSADCANIGISSMLSNIENFLVYNEKNSLHVLLPMALKAYSPEALKSPPISIS